jgi:hypothetical protein
MVEICGRTFKETIQGEWVKSVGLFQEWKRWIIEIILPDLGIGRVFEKEVIT